MTTPIKLCHVCGQPATRTCSAVQSVPSPYGFPINFVHHCPNAVCDEHGTDIDGQTLCECHNHEAATEESGAEGR